MARLAHRSAHRVAAFLAVLLANLLRHLAAVHMAVLLVHRLAHRVAALFLAMLRHAAAHAAFHILAAMLDARLALGALDFLPARPRHRLAALDHLGPVLGDVAIAKACFAYVLVAGLLDFVDDRLGLVAGVPALFHDGVIDQLVTHTILLLACGEAALRVATPLGAACVTDGATVRRGRNWNHAQQRGQREQQRRSLAHLHDLASSSARKKWGTQPVLTG
jgi:hypothetical protein